MFGDTDNLDLTAERAREREKEPAPVSCRVESLLCSDLETVYSQQSLSVSGLSGLCIVLCCNATPLFPPPAVAV